MARVAEDVDLFRTECTNKLGDEEALPDAVEYTPNSEDGADLERVETETTVGDRCAKRRKREGKK